MKYEDIEIGKVYVDSVGTEYEVLAKSREHVWAARNKALLLTHSIDSFETWTPKPEEIVRYFNIYGDGLIGTYFNTRKEADMAHSLVGPRIGCQRVVFKPDTWDE